MPLGILNIAPGLMGAGLTTMMSTTPTGSTLAACCNSLMQQAMMNQRQTCTTSNPAWYGMQNATSTAGMAYYLEQQGMVWVDSQQYFQLAQQRVPVYQARTAEQQRIAEEQAAKQIALYREQQARAIAARTRSRELLLSHLTPAQRETFEKKKWFVIVGGQSRRRYRIRDAGHAGNIDVLNGEKVMHRLCCHCDHSIPIHDNMLAQKLTLEYDESTFLRLANRHAA